MLNPNEAPSDCIAIKAEGCRGCVFEEGVNECSQKGPKIIPCVSDFRDDKTSVIFKLKQPQPDLLNAATHERRERTVTINAELSAADVSLRRAVEIQIREYPIGTCHALKTAYEQVLSAGGGAK